MLKFYKQISRLSQTRKLSNSIKMEESKTNKIPYSQTAKLNFVNTAYHSLPIDENPGNKIKEVIINLF